MSTTETAGNQGRKDLNKDLVICPLTFKVTGGRSAVNYDLAPSKIKVGDDTIPGWRSSPQKRGHTELFEKGLKRLKETGKIPESWNAFYFTQEQGEEARVAYENLVMRGKVKAHRRSWGPTDEQGGQDKSRFHHLVTAERVEKHNASVDEHNREFPDEPAWMKLEHPVTYAQLTKVYPELYGTKTTTKEGSTTTETAEAAAITSSGLDAMNIEDLTEEEVLEKIEGTSGDKEKEQDKGPDTDIVEEKAEPTAEDLEEVQEEAREAVAASTTTEEPSIASLDDLRIDEIDETEPVGEVEVKEKMEGDGEESIIRLKHPIGSEQTVGADAITWQDSKNEMRTAYLVWIPGLDRDMWLEEGAITIDGEDVTVEVLKTALGGGDKS